MIVSTDRRLSLVADADYFLALVDQGLLKKITNFPDTHCVAITDFAAYELAVKTNDEAQRATEFISRHPHLIMTHTVNSDDANKLDGTVDALHGTVRVSTRNHPDQLLDAMVNATTPLDTNTVSLAAFARQMTLAEQIIRDDVEILKVLVK